MKLTSFKVFKRIMCGGLVFALTLPVISACKKQATESYTYTHYVISTPNTWNPHRLESDDESMISSLVTDSLLTFSLNQSGDGYAVSPSLAKALPTDVSAKYKGMMNVPSNALNGSGYAWRFELREDAAWEDGTPINSQTFVYSIEQLLDKNMSNKRAVDITQGTAAIYGAYSYMYGDSIVFNPAINDDFTDYTSYYREPGAQVYFGWDMPMPKIFVSFFSDAFGYDLVTWADLYQINPDAFKISIDSQTTDIYIKWTEHFADSVSGSLLIINDASNGPSFIVTMEEVDEIITDLVELMYKWLLSPEAGDDSGYYLGYGQIMDSFGGEYAKCHSNIINDALAYVNSYDEPVNPWIYELFLGVQSYIPSLSWSNVGFKKDNSNNYAFEVIFASPITSIYDLAYHFASKPILVHKDVYEECKIQPSQSGGLVRSKYATDSDTTISYGAYRIKEYKTGESIHLVKNENWFGHKDSAYTNQYQTTDIIIKLGLAESAALGSFLKGELSMASISGEQATLYSGADYIKNMPNAKNYKLVLNSDRTKLEQAQRQAGEGVNKIMLSYLDFRKAIAFSADRAAIINSISPIAKSEYGLINSTYISNSTTNTVYRDETLAKLALVAVTNPSIASEYEDILSPWNANNFLSNINNTVAGESYTYGQRLDWLYDNLTSHNETEAKSLFVSAFSAAIENGDYDPSQTVTIKLVADQPTPSADFLNQASLLQQSIDSVLKDTPYASKVAIQTGGSSSMNMLKQNIRLGLVDAAIVYSEGDAFSALNALNDLYVDNALRLEYGMNSVVTKNIDITIKINGLNQTRSLWQWATSLSGDATITNSEQESDTINHTKSNYETRLLIATAIEYYYLSQFAAIPLYSADDHALISKQINMGSATYLPYIGFGGIRYITYNYTDSQWNDYTKAQGTNLY